MRALILALAALCVLPAAAQQEVEDAKRTVTAIENALKARPDDPTLWFFLSRFQSVAGNKAAAISAIEKAEQVGEGYLPSRENGFEKVWDEPAFQAAVRRMAAKLPRVDFPPTAFELQDRGLIPEGIAHDPKSGSFFIGSIAKGTIVRVEPPAQSYLFAGPESGLDQVLGIAIDVPRRILYAVSTSVLTDAGRKKARNAVVAFDVDSQRLLRRVEVPAAKQLNDVAIGLGGRVFVSDSEGGAIFEIPAEGPAKVLVPEGQLRGTNGIAVWPDGKRLYAAHSTGVAVVDIASAAVKRVPTPARESVAVIDGLYVWQGGLVGVQNYTTPGRVIFMDLSADGASITRVRTLLSHHHPALFEPTTGAPTDNGFYLLAATGVMRYNRQGVIENADTVPKPTILRIPLPR
jgi:hypothetical protein